MLLTTTSHYYFSLLLLTTASHYCFLLLLLTTAFPPLRSSLSLRIDTEINTPYALGSARAISGRLNRKHRQDALKQTNLSGPLFGLIFALIGAMAPAAYADPSPATATSEVSPTEADGGPAKPITLDPNDPAGYRAAIAKIRNTPNRDVFVVGPDRKTTTKIRIQSYLGSGSYTSVFRAIDPETKKPVALRLFRGEHLENEKRFADIYHKGAKDFADWNADPKKIDLPVVAEVSHVPDTYTTMSLIGENRPFSDFTRMVETGKPDDDFTKMNAALDAFLKQMVEVDGIADLHGENLVWEKNGHGPNGRMVITDWSQVNVGRPGQTAIIPEGSKARAEPFLDAIFGPSEQINGRKEYANLEQFKAEIVRRMQGYRRAHYANLPKLPPSGGNRTIENCPPTDAKTRGRSGKLNARISSTLGALSIVLTAVQAIDGQSNPFAYIAPNCSDARKKKGRLLCERSHAWLGLGEKATVTCSRVDRVTELFLGKGVPSGKTACEVEYAWYSFDIEGEDAETKLERAGYFDPMGVAGGDPAHDAVLAQLGKLVRLVDPVFIPQVRYPVERLEGQLEMN